MAPDPAGSVLPGFHLPSRHDQDLPVAHRTGRWRYGQANRALGQEQRVVVGTAERFGVRGPHRLVLMTGLLRRPQFFRSGKSDRPARPRLVVTPGPGRLRHLL